MVFKHETRNNFKYLVYVASISRKSELFNIDYHDVPTGIKQVNQAGIL